MMYMGSFGSVEAWLWVSAVLLLVAGLVLIGAWAVASSNRPVEDEALALLRARFARGELDSEAFEAAHKVLGATAPQGGRRQTLAVVGVALVTGAVVTALLAGALTAGGPGGRLSGVAGPQVRDGLGGAPGPLAGTPVGLTIRMAAARFQPATVTVPVGQTVRWVNDDSVAHTVTGADRGWTSGSVPPGGTFERRFDTPGKYAYLCVDHPRMTGTITVTR